MSTDRGFTVRAMRPGEVKVIRAWADAEGWNPGTHDGPMLWAADPDGFFVGALVRRFGLVEVFRTARMYARGVPAVATARIYGISSLELG